MNSNSVASTKNFELRAPSSMSEEEVLALIDDTPFAVLSTSDAEGVPYGVPVTTLRMGRSIYFHGSRARMSRKLVNLSLKPFASLCWVGENQIVEKNVNVRFASAVAAGPVCRIEENKEELDRFIRFMFDRRAPSLSSEERAAYVESNPTPAVWRLDIEQLTGRFNPGDI